MTEEKAVDARKFDPVSALMAVVAAIAILWAGWLRFGPPPLPEPLAPGAKLPPLKLIDPETNEPILLLGLRDKVVWVTFWSANAPQALSDLADLQRIWTRFSPRSKFAMVAVAVDLEEPGPLLEMLANTKASLPAYLAEKQTRNRFGTDAVRLPMHLLIDETGKVSAVAQGRDGATFARLTEQTKQRLDAIDPIGQPRFVWGEIRFNRR